MTDLLTINEVATVLRCSPDSATKRMTGVPGVIDLGTAETRTKRRYRVLRVPRAVLEKFLSLKAGQTITIRKDVYQ